MGSNSKRRRCVSDHCLDFASMLVDRIRGFIGHPLFLLPFVAFDTVVLIGYNIIWAMEGGLSGLVVGFLILQSPVISAALLENRRKIRAFFMKLKDGWETSEEDAEKAIADLKKTRPP